MVLSKALNRSTIDTAKIRYFFRTEKSTHFLCTEKCATFFRTEILWVFISSTKTGYVPENPNICILKIGQVVVTANHSIIDKCRYGFKSRLVHFHRHTQ